MRLAVPLLALLLVAGTAAAERVRVTLVGHPPKVTVGTAWTAKLAVRPAAFSGAVRVTAKGSGRITARATGRRGSYRVRLVFPQPGRWTLSAHAGGSSSRLGVLSVQRRAEPLAFVYPTSVAVEPDGLLLVAENGRDRVYRIDPATGNETLLVDHLHKAYSVIATAGRVLASSDEHIVRLEPAPQASVVTAADQVGPITAAPNGDLLFTTGSAAFRVPAGSNTPVPIVTGLAAPHGIAVLADGAVLVADTEHDRILRIDPSTEDVATFARMERPGGMAPAPDGGVYVCAMLADRVLHLNAAGTRTGFVGPTFLTPYALAADGEGGLYVAEATAVGDIRHVAADGKVTTVSSRPAPAAR
jgi:DNA-binding beta-propeller fold protein YncE